MSCKIRRIGLTNYDDWSLGKAYAYMGLGIVPLSVYTFKLIARVPYHPGPHQFHKHRTATSFNRNSTLGNGSGLYSSG